MNAPTVATALSGRITGGVPSTSGSIEYASLLVGWAVLLALAAVVLLIVGVAARVQDRHGEPGPPPPWAGAARATPADLSRMRAEAETLGRQAGAAVAGAQRARAHAVQEQARCAAARQSRDAAIQRHEAAYQAYQAARRELTASAPAPPVPDRPAGADDGDAADGHQLERAAFAAYRGGFLSVDELSEIWRRASGWNPLQEQREHEVARLRAEERDARRQLHAATAAERLACKQAGIAEIAAQAMADEAAEAIEEARVAREVADAWARRLARRHPWPRGGPR